MTKALPHAPPCQSALTSDSSYSASTSSSSLWSGGSTCRLIERTSSRLASEYARTTEELVGYVSFLEGALERVGADSHRFQREAADAREHAALANHRLTLAHRHAQALSQHKDQAIEAARHGKEQLRLTQDLLAEEQLRIKNLESQIEVSEEASTKKDKLLDQRKRKERKARKALEKQNQSLLRKATLSWILACLSNPYLEVDTSKERTASLMRMAQDLLRSDDDLSMKAQNLLSFSDMKASSLRLECSYVQNEIRQLLQISESSQEETPELSSGRSCEDQHTNRSSDVDKEERDSRFKRQQCKGRSPRSILKAVHEESHHLLGAAASDHAGRGCRAHDQPESKRFLSKESKVRAHRDNAYSVKKKQPLTRLHVPPLQLPGTGNSIFFNSQSVQDDHEDGDDERALCLDDNDYGDEHFLKKNQDRAAAWDPVLMKALVNKRQAKRKQIQQCQTDIMKTLRGLKTNMGYLLDSEERKHFK